MIYITYVFKTHFIQSETITHKLLSEYLYIKHLMQLKF